MGTRKFGFVMEAVTEPSTETWAWRKVFLKGFAMCSLYGRSVVLKTYSSPWNLSPWKVICPHGQTCTFKHSHRIKMKSLHTETLENAHSEYSHSRVNISTQGSIINHQMFYFRDLELFIPKYASILLLVFTIEVYFISLIPFLKNNAYLCSNLNEWFQSKLMGQIWLGK